MIITKNANPGQLFVVATPIGNLEDMSPRAIRILKEVDLIAAEDTRHSRGLLNHYAISTPLISYHDYNESQKAEQLIQDMLTGKFLALISDAGTPLINDPGFKLINLAHKAGIKVTPIPGACAAIAALSAAGINSDRFAFEGFLPTKLQQRLNYLEKLAKETRTLIFYEAPHRILDSLQAMLQIFGEDRQATVARELTKIYETIRTDSLENIIEWMQKDVNQQKGEFVILLAGAQVNSESENIIITLEHLLKSLLADLPLKQAVTLAVTMTGYPKNQIYEKALLLKK